MDLIFKFLSLIGATTLFEAIERNDGDGVRRLAANPSILNKRENGNYPLKAAIQKGNHEIVKTLLDAGAEVNPRLERGEKPPLFLACRLEENDDYRGNAAVPIVKLLLDHGADSNIINDNDDLFGYCVFVRAWKVCHYLLERPDVVVDVNQRMGMERYGLLLLEFCYNTRQFKLMRALVEKGNANLAAVDIMGRTPLFLSARDLTGETTKVMLVKGANANYQIASGLTALHYALLHGNKKMIRILLENGADSNASSPEILPPALYILDIIQQERNFGLLRGLTTLLKNSEANLPFGHGTIMDEIIQRISPTQDKNIVEYAPLLMDLLRTGSLQPAHLQNFQIFKCTAVSSRTFEKYFKEIMGPLLVESDTYNFFDKSKLSLKAAISLSKMYHHADFCSVAMAFYEYSNKLRLPKVYESLLDTKLFEFYYEESKEIFAKMNIDKIPFDILKSIWMERINPDMARKCKRRSMTLRVIAIMGNHLGLGERETNFNISDEHLRTFLDDLVREIEPKLKDNSKNRAISK